MKGSQVYPRGYGRKICKLHLKHVVTGTSWPERVSRRRQSTERSRVRASIRKTLPWSSSTNYGRRFLGVSQGWIPSLV